VNARIFALAHLIAATAATPNIARAETLDAQQNALELITNTADKICNVVSTKGEANSSEVKGNVTAQLRGLASKLADVGVSGTGSITTEQYESVLRSDLAATLKDNAACKLKVFDTLQNKLLGSGAASAPNIGGTWHDTNDPNNVTRITQQGDRFEFTRTGTLNGILRYESSGSGRMSGETYTSEYHAKYENGETSTGRCSGTLRREGILTTNCNDTKLREFSGAAFRE
jgi:hypothetical protein